MGQSQFPRPTMEEIGGGPVVGVRFWRGVCMGLALTSAVALLLCLFVLQAGIPIALAGGAIFVVLYYVLGPTTSADAKAAKTLVTLEGLRELYAKGFIDLDEYEERIEQLLVKEVRRGNAGRSLQKGRV